MIMKVKAAFDCYQDLKRLMTVKVPTHRAVKALNGSERASRAQRRLSQLITRVY